MTGASRRPRVVSEITELRALVRDRRAGGASVALVPTMGALHEGHLALVRRATELAEVVVVSVFVNPLQFAPGEDLDRYPRTLEADLDALAGLGVEAVFAPSVAEMYPDGPPSTRVIAGPVGALYEGAGRPGHFDGMLTVVAKLFNIVGPDVATFGRKDAQQLFLIERMITDLSFPVRIEPIEVVREDDGLAMSSRNRYLSPDERRAATALHRSLEAARSAADRGSIAATAAAQAVTMGDQLVDVDYFALVDPETFDPIADDYTGLVIAITAARVGATRLIDTERFRVG